MTLRNPWKEFLVKPPQRTDIFSLFAQWQQLDILFQLDAYAITDDDWSQDRFAFPNRVRGALGDVLTRSASQPTIMGQECPWSPPCALDIFFRNQLMLSGGADLTKPIRFIAAREGDQIYVTISLFGQATQYAEVVAEALSTAFREGVYFTRCGKRPLPIENRSIMPAPIDLPDELPYAIALNFMSPFVQRKDDAPIFNPISLMIGLVKHMESMALWHGIALEVLWQDIKREAELLAWDSSHLVAEQWKRGSNKQDKIFDMQGLRGPLLAQGNLHTLFPYLILGERSGIGGYTGMGLGRYYLEYL